MRTERVTAPGDSRASVPTDHALEDDSEQPVRPPPRTLVYAGRELYFRTGGMTATSTAYRFLPGTQGSAHVLAMPECASRDLDGTGHAIQTFALSDNRAAHATDDRYTVTFGVIRLRC